MWLNVQICKIIKTFCRLFVTSCIFLLLLWKMFLFYIYIHFYDIQLQCVSDTQLLTPPTPVSPMWPSVRVRLCVHLFLRVWRRHRSRRPRPERRVSGKMDYQQKLAEKFTILNDRGNGVLIRMNYIKKVRDNRKMYRGKCVSVTEIRNLTFNS